MTPLTSPLSSVATQTIIFAAYGLICTVGLACNVLFIASVGVSREKKRSVTRMLIANLALSDILTLLFALFSPISAITSNWQFGVFWCKLTQSCSAMSIFVSSFSATAIALHRYVSIVEPHLKKLQPTTAWPVIAATWTLALCFSAAIFVQSQVYEVVGERNGSNRSQWRCAERWDDDNMHGQLYTVSCLAIQFVLPTLIIGVCYGRVSIVLHNRLRFHLSRACHQTQRRIVASIRRQRRTTRTLVLMLSLYILSWMPFNIFMVTLIFNLNFMANWSYMEITYVFMHVLAVSSALHNPIVYSWAHEEFRRQARADLKHCCTKFLRSVRHKTSSSVTVTSQHLDDRFSSMSPLGYLASDSNNRSFKTAKRCDT